MKEGWRTVFLADYYEISSGLSKPAEDFGSGFPFLSFKDVFGNFFTPPQLSGLVNSTEKERAKCSIQLGDVFLTRTSETSEELGMSCVALKTYENATFNGFTKRLRPIRENEIDPHFIAYYLRSPKFRGEISAFSNLITRASLNNDAISRLKIDLPPIETQRKIGLLLFNYNSLIENNLQRIKLLEELAQRTYEEWFVKFRVNGVDLEVDAESGLPRGWERKNLNDIADIAFGFPFKANQFNNSGAGIPIIRIRNIPHSDTNDFTTEKVDPKYFVERGDLLVGMDGEFYVNNWCGPKAYLVQRSCNIKARDRRFHGYLSQAIVPPVKFFEATISGATVAHLGKKHLDTIEIIIPSPVYHGIFDMFNDWLNLKITLAHQNRHLKESRDILLPRLMSGEIKV